jgi:hypothetical protein
VKRVIDWVLLQVAGAALAALLWLMPIREE